MRGGGYMKVGDNLYECGFCGTVKNQFVNLRTGDGKKGVAADQVRCLKCGNYISQKTRGELIR